MKQRVGLFISILLVLALISHMIVQKATSKTVSITADGKQYNVLVADSPEEYEKGLMFIRKKEGFDGMVFIFPDKQVRYFWNQNTFVDLDIYWLEDDTVKGMSHLPSIEKTKEPATVTSPPGINKVLEVIR